jgi:hypothetical protein
MEDKELLSPGWYLARDNNSKWWNLFVYVTKELPYKCIKIINGELSYTYIMPEKIGEVSQNYSGFTEKRYARKGQSNPLGKVPVFFSL